MPELPEVETVRRQLIPYCRGQSVAEVVVKTPYLLKNCTTEGFEASWRNKTIRSIERLGKYLIFHCDSCYPVFHLGMTGIFLTDRANSRYPQHIHVDIRFESGKHLFFQDMRKFGKIWLYYEQPEFPRMGIDPISGNLRPESLKRLLKRHRKTIKFFLMDQSHIAGIGNIYASEILYLSKISPFRQTSTLAEAEITALHLAIHQVLTSAIDRFGTTYSAYRTVSGESGTNQDFLKVYQRAGFPCERCGSEIQKTVMGSRSTFYCENCQF